MSFENELHLNYVENNSQLELSQSLANPEQAVLEDLSVLDNFLATGANGDDAHSYWQCAITSGGTSNQFPLRFYRDQTGFLGENQFSWKTLSDSETLLVTDVGQIRLSNLQTVGGILDRFSAEDSYSVQIACTWAGRSRHLLSEQTLDDDIGSYSLLLDGQNNKSYSCTESYDQAGNSGFSLSLSNQNNGQLNGKTIKWYIPRDSNLYVSDGKSVDVFANLFVLEKHKSGIRRFHATRVGNLVECSSL